jgi:hypothetical protein
MTIDINRREIAIRYNNERRSNRLATCNKYGFGLVYTTSRSGIRCCPTSSRRMRGRAGIRSST